jgi:phosphoribosylglycinamide formyltransferase-1
MSLSKEAYNDPLQADVVIRQELERAGAEYVVMAGYMRMVHSPILGAFPNRVINIHPALLPSFAGAHGIADAFNYGVKVTGVTVHIANEEYDKGAILAQEPVRIDADDTLETLEAKIHEVEHRLYPKVLQQIATGEIAL